MNEAHQIALDASEGHQRHLNDLIVAFDTIKITK